MTDRAQPLRRGFGFPVAIVLLVVAFAIAGCGGDDEGDGGGAGTEVTEGAQEARDLVRQEQRVPKWEQPGPPFDASQARGTTIWYVPVSNAIPLSKLLGDVMSEAAGTVGAVVRTCDGQGQVAQFVRCIDQGVGQNVDAIVLQSIPTDLVRPQIEDARDAGIPVIQSQERDPGFPPSEEQEAGVVAKVGFSFSGAGRRMAHAAIADAGGPMKAVALEASDVPESQDVKRGLSQEFEQYCPECELEFRDVPVAQWETRIPTLTQAIVRDQSVDYLIPIYDNMAIFAIPAVNAAGAAQRVRMVTFNATPAVMQELANENVVVAEVGNANVWAGWAFMDQTLRVLTGTDPVEDEGIPFRTFTNQQFDGEDWDANIDTIDVDAHEGTWYGPVDPAERYQDLWGVE